jgi:uncharacterized protein with PhoU and TrkA domain
MNKDYDVQLHHLTQHTFSKEHKLECCALLLKRDNDFTILPEDDFSVQSGDKLLFCGINNSYRRMKTVLNDEHMLFEILTNKKIMRSYLLRKLFKQTSPCETENHCP